MVADGHLKLDVPKHTTFSTLVSRESVRLIFTLASLNNLDLLVGHIGNAFLNAIPRENCDVTIRDEYMFGTEVIGKKVKMVRALYVMKSSGAVWHDTISSHLYFEMKFEQCKAEPDVWFKRDFDRNCAYFYSYI